jgi:hypothetical protein
MKLSKEEELALTKARRRQRMKRIALRTGVISTFLVGLFMVMFGAVSLGSTISEPALTFVLRGKKHKGEHNQEKKKCLSSRTLSLQLLMVRI